VALAAFIGLLRAHASATRELSSQLLADHGLTINDFEALLRLARAENGMMRRVDLAREILLTPSGVTRLLEGLERAGYVEKRTCESDARVTYAAVTPLGRSKLKAASRTHTAQVESLFSASYSGAELATLADLLERLGDGSEPGACEAT
jgi:DNA-binding MarR family transcriptional regulator